MIICYIIIDYIIIYYNYNNKLYVHAYGQMIIEYVIIDCLIINYIINCIIIGYIIKNYVKGP